MRVMPNGMLPMPAPEAESRPVQPHAPVAEHAGVEPTPQEVRQASAAINAALQSLSAKVQFVVGTDGKTVVKVIDGETNEVIRQMPSAETLAIARAIDRMQGLLLHQKA